MNSPDVAKCKITFAIKYVFVEIKICCAEELASQKFPVIFCHYTSNASYQPCETLAMSMLLNEFFISNLQKPC